MFLLSLLLISFFVMPSVSPGPDTQVVFVLSPSSARRAGFVTLSASNWRHWSDNRAHLISVVQLWCCWAPPVWDTREGKSNIRYSAQIPASQVKENVRYWIGLCFLWMWLNEKADMFLECMFLCACLCLYRPFITTVTSPQPQRLNLNTNIFSSACFSLYVCVLHSLLYLTITSTLCPPTHFSPEIHLNQKWKKSVFKVLLKV